MKVSDVEVVGDLPEQEVQRYLTLMEEKHGSLSALKVVCDGDFVDLHYKKAAVPFERIRRITGYLVGDMRHWNDAKTAEERDRVKHA